MLTNGIKYKIKCIILTDGYVNVSFKKECQISYKHE